jgi:hypothetical protein
MLSQQAETGEEEGAREESQEMEDELGGFD